MNKIALSTLILGLTAAASSALAQNAPPPPCPPGSWLCADITIGGPPPPAPVVVQPPPPPPPVVVTPPPPPPQPVVVAPAPPPPVVIIPPRHPRVIIAPAPPARVYVVPAPPPPTVVYQPQPVYVQGPPQYVGPRYYEGPRQRGHVGLMFDVAGALFNGASGGTSGMAGIGGGFRFRGAHHLGAELAISGLWGNDYAGDHRSEVPFSFNGMIYFNPMHRLQVYGLLGIGFSYADVTYSSNNVALHGGRASATYGYFGADAGLGLELQISRHLSAFADARGFIRTRIDDGQNSNPEYVRTVDGHTQTTNASMGVLTQAGLILYF